MAKKIKIGSVFFRDQYSRLVDGGAPSHILEVAEMLGLGAALLLPQVGLRGDPRI